MSDDFSALRTALDSLERIKNSALDAGAVQAALLDMSTSLSAMVQAMERETPPWAAELVAAIRQIEIRVPDIVLPPQAPPVVNLPALPAPVVNNLPASPAPMQAQLLPTGMRMRVIKRDELGRLAEVAFIMEN